MPVADSPQPTVPSAPSRAALESVRSGLPPQTLDAYLGEWETFFDEYADTIDDWHHRNAGYHKAVASLGRFHVPPGMRVLEIGSGNGDLLAALEPSHGVGVDLSSRMVARATGKYPHLRFVTGAAEQLALDEDAPFDYIVLSDMVGYLYDIRLAFEKLRPYCHPQTRIVINWYSRLWQPVLTAAEKLGLKYPQPLLNWTTREDISNLLRLAGFEVVHQREHMLMPKRIPGISYLLNRFIAHLPGFQWMCLTNWIVARPIELPARKPPVVSIVCPCRNEEGNIPDIVRRLPYLGSHTELIFVEGHSKDGTLDACHRAAAENPDRDITVLRQTGKGKADAVWLGFEKAKGDVLMILDADLSVAPEDLVQFYDALVSGKGEFINGSRLVYTMDPEAMRFLNLLGNKFFALLLSQLIGQSVKDTLCGTKVMWRESYLRLAAGRTYFGHFDPFGDFDLIFGASKLNLKIIELPVRYRQRVYGDTNISRFSDGWLLLKMSARAALKLFFTP